MPLLYDWTKELSATTGTGTVIALSGAVVSFIQFADNATLADGDIVGVIIEEGANRLEADAVYSRTNATITLGALYRKLEAGVYTEPAATPLNLAGSATIMMAQTRRTMALSRSKTIPASTGDGESWTQIDNNQTYINLGGNISNLLHTDASTVSDGNTTVSIASNTTINLSAGSGTIRDITTDPLNPVSAVVAWAGDPALLVNFFSHQYGITVITIDSAGLIAQFDSRLTPEQFRTHIPIAKIVYENSIVVEAATFQFVANSSNSVLNDFIAFKQDGAIRGFEISPAATPSIDLSVGRSPGDNFLPGYAVGTNNPNIRSFLAITQLDIYQFDRNENLIASSTQIVKQWDNNGTVTGFNNNRAYVHYLFAMPSGTSVILLGQIEYSSFSAAFDGARRDAAKMIEPPLFDSAVFLAAIIIHNDASDFSNNSISGIINR